MIFSKIISGDSSMIEHSTDQLKDGGLNPTSPLHKLRVYKDIVDFIGSGKSCHELFKVVDMRFYWGMFNKGLFYFDNKAGKHMVNYGH